MMLTVQLVPEVLIEKDAGAKAESFLTRPHPLVTIPNLYFRVMISDAIPEQHAEVPIDMECEYLQKDLATYIKSYEFGQHLKTQVRMAWKAKNLAL